MAGTTMTRTISPEYLARLTAPRTIHFWGDDYEVTPVLLDHIDGDGLRLLVIEPLNTRPNYYLARVDSSTRGDDEDDAIVDLIEELLDEAEDQFGSHREELDEGEDAADVDLGEGEWIEGEPGETQWLYRGWPAPSLDSGWSWGDIDVPPEAIVETEAS